MTKQELKDQLVTKLETVKQRQFVVDGRLDAVSRVQDLLDVLSGEFDVQADRLASKLERAERHLEEVDELETVEVLKETAKVASILKFAELK